MTITLEEAKARLEEIIDQMNPGEVLSITRESHPVAELIKQAPPPKEPRQPGSAIGKILYMADDFDAPLEDFKDYMP